MTRKDISSAPLASPVPAAASVLRRKCSCGNRSSGGGTCAECGKKNEEQGTLRRFSSSAVSSGGSAPPVVNEVLSSPGHSLDGVTRSYFEPRFQQDFSGVRVHSDSRAAESARAVNAAAYTVGNRIVMDSSHADAQGARRASLLAHELAHVEQSGGRSPGSAPLTVGAANAPEEHAADARAHEVMSGGDASGALPPRTLDGALSVRRAPPQTVDAAMCEANQNPNPARLGDCSYKEPEHCATYEAWMRTFRLLKTFKSRDTPGANETDFQVLGGDDEKADRGFEKPGNPAKPAARLARPSKPGEDFIDHPTDSWVKTCLPQNLRATAYELPADCADVAIILRHVWLSAHHRTEKFLGWTLGSAAGKDEADNIHKVIASEGTATVAGMVNPYTAPDGRLLRSYAELERLLHPGDVLVWEHHAPDDKTFQRGRTGGHTHTIADIFWEPSGKISQMTLLQGNEPLFKEQKQDIHDFLGKKAKPTFKQLGDAPGRRIERQTAAQSGLVLDASTDQNVKVGKQTVPIWVWDGDTLLVAAGPPRAAARPAAQAVKGAKGPALRAVTDWIAPLLRAGTGAFQGTFEGMLYELRAAVEGGGAVAEADVRAIGAAAGKRASELDGKAAAGAATQLTFLTSVVNDFAWSRDIATSRNLDSAYDLITTGFLKHLRWLREAIAKGAGAKP